MDRMLLRISSINSRKVIQRDIDFCPTLRLTVPDRLKNSPARLALLRNLLGALQRGRVSSGQILDPLIGRDRGPI